MMLRRIDPLSQPALTSDDWSLDADAWCRQAIPVHSPNFGDRPPGVIVDLLVIHNISLPLAEFDGDYILDLFQNRLDYDAHPSFSSLRGVQVSSHFLVRRDGRVFQFVAGSARAWHAGVSQFQGREGCNDFSIGIELEGCDTCAFTDRQYTSLAHLSVCLMRRFPLRFIVGHQDIAPGRKTDPGPYFDWLRYQQSVAGWDLC